MDGTIGTIMLFAGDRGLVNWLPCEGQLLPISENQALFSILGTSFGGDGQRTVGLPKFAPLASVAPGQGSVRYFICVNGLYPRTV